MMRLLAMLLLGLGLAANAQPARIILLRHAEKPTDPANPDLSQEGRKRADRLVKWLTQGKVLGTNGRPAALYAARPTPHGRSIRCLETLRPTADQLGLPVQTPYRAGEYLQLAHNILRNRSLKGKTVVVCWVHECLPPLAAALGVEPEPPKWKDRDFESAYVITYPKKRASLEVIHQRFKLD